MKFSYIIIFVLFSTYFFGQSQMYLSNDKLDEKVFDGQYYNGYHYFLLAKGEMNYEAKDYEFALVKFSEFLEPVDTLVLQKIEEYQIVSGKLKIINDTIFLFGTARKFQTDDVQLYELNATLDFNWTEIVLFGNDMVLEGLTSVYEKPDGSFLLAGSSYPNLGSKPYLFIANCSRKGELFNFFVDSTWSSQLPQIIHLETNNKYYFVDQYITSIYDIELNHDTTIFSNTILYFLGRALTYDSSHYFTGGNGFWVYKKNRGIVQLDDEEDIIEITYYLMDSSAKQVDSGFIAIPYINDYFGGLDFNSTHELVFGGVSNAYFLQGDPPLYEKQERTIVVKSINYDTKEENWYFEYGGDVNYMMKGLYIVEETGECIVYSERYDWRGSDLLQHDILIFKIDSTGLLVGITEMPPEVEYKLTLFPNPGKDRMFMKGISGYSEVTFYDLFGRRVLDAVVGDTNEPISTDRLKKGTYVVKIHDSNLNYFEPVIWIKQ